ncbi:MAG: FadR family transcriptional regulator [Clostridiales bacterium]|nr:FadR family transcriptional regulator [Clostridiales bacterium]
MIRMIEKSNLVDEVYNQLLQMIASSEWREGDKLPSESKLCETLGVSRNTIRAALSKLNAIGLVETRQGFGYCVRNLNTGVYLNTMLPTMLLRSRDFISITEFRIGVEGEAAYMAALRADENDIATMEQTWKMSAQAIDDSDAFAKYDMQFHRQVALASRNDLFIKVAEILENMYTVWLMGFLRTHGKERSNDFHHNIFTSIARHEPDQAKYFMEEHLKDVLMKVKRDVERKESLKKQTEPSV